MPNRKTQSIEKFSCVLIFLLTVMACTVDTNELRGRWALDRYSVDDVVTQVVEGVNTQSKPVFEFDEYVSGVAGCNNFGDNGDHEYVFQRQQLTFPDNIVKDAGLCAPDNLMTVELFLEQVLWSGAEITVDIDDDSMRWRVEDLTLHFSRVD